MNPLFDLLGIENVKCFSAEGLDVSLENAIDYDKELARLSQELVKVEAGVARGEAMFNNPSFVARAPHFKIDTARKILDDYLSKRSTILKRIAELKSELERLKVERVDAFIDGDQSKVDYYSSRMTEIVSELESLNVLGN